MKPAARRLNWLWLALIALPVVLIVGGLGTLFWRKAEKGEMHPKWRKPAAGSNTVPPTAPQPVLAPAAPSGSLIP